MTDNLWECPKCGHMMTQPACVKEVVHRCREKSSQSVALKLVSAAKPSTDPVIISGSSYRAAPPPEEWPEPTVRKVGRGSQYIYDSSMAEEIERHLRTAAEAEEATSDEIFALVYDADRIAAR